VREAADFFGAAAWPAAVGFLKETAADPAAPEPVQTAALAALARLATEPARAALQGLYDHQGGRLAEEAGRWLEELVRRRARWAELGNPS
jgi:hypothetical protein